MVLADLPGTAKVEFCFGALGIDLVQDEVSKVQCGSQAETKGVKAGWKITLINGNEMAAIQDIRPTLDRAKKTGKKYFITFSKPAAEMQADLAMQKAKEAKRAEEEAVRKKEEAARKAEKDKIEAEENAKKEKSKNEASAKAAGGGGAGFVKPKEVQPVAAKVEEKKNIEGDQVTLKYYQYSEPFAIDGGKLSVKEVDGYFAMSEVMPGCGIHLGEKEPVYGEDNVYLKEDPVGTVINLKPGGTYWIFVVQDPEQEKKDMERMKGVWANQPGEGGERGEGCSCLFGTPCTDQYVCLDWENRMAVAKKNGMLPNA